MKGVRWERVVERQRAARCVVERWDSICGWEVEGRRLVQN